MILIGHDVDTVFEVGDRVVVLRLGRVVHDGPTSELTTVDLVHLMAGLVVKREPQPTNASTLPTTVTA